MQLNDLYTLIEQSSSNSAISCLLLGLNKLPGLNGSLILFYLVVVSSY